VLGCTGTPTLTMRVKVGSNYLLDGPAITMSGTVSGDRWELEADLVLWVDNGPFSTFGRWGKFWYDNAAHDRSVVGLDDGVLANLNVTAAHAMDITAQWGTANSLNTITCDLLTLKALN
jgi:hypothetical protein